MSAGKTYHTKGDKTIEMKKTTGKSRLTVLLSVSSSGAKLPPYIPYIIIESSNKTIFENPLPNHCIVRHNSKIDKRFMLQYSLELLREFD